MDGVNHGKVFPPEAQAWIRGEMTTADYWEYVQTIEAPKAAEQVHAALERKRQLRNQSASPAAGIGHALVEQVIPASE